MSRPIWSDQILFGLSTYKKRLPVRKGFSVVEVLLASTVFVLLVTGLVGALIYGREAAATAGQRGRATALAEEGIEALRNLRDEGFSNLVDGPHGLDEISSEWQYSGTSDITDGFARVVTIGSVDADTKSVTSTVTWQQTPSRTGSVSLVTYLTDWQETVGGGPGGGSPATYGGMLAYSDTTVNGGDGVVYKTLDTAGNWSAAANVPDITVPNDRPAVRVELHASPTRDEKILLT
ncbi:MAG: hypothetical protein Q8P33_01935, partial [bacterium]|nr:hypothetical protein [bacterium]